MGGGVMTLMGLLFIFFNHALATLMSDDPNVIDLTAGCIRIAGFAQIGFAAAMIFGFAMRGAGDTMRVMVINILSIFAFRLAGVIIAVRYFHVGLHVVWYILCGELMLRGIAMFLRFRFGHWEKVRV